MTVNTGVQPLTILSQRDIIEAFLKACFKPGYPGAEVKVDRSFLDHVCKGKVVVAVPGTYRIVGNKELDRDTNPLNANVTASLVHLFGQGVDALAIGAAEGPTQPGDEVERNLLLGWDFINDVPHYLFIEHEWKMKIDGAIHMEIHLHARRTGRQFWDADDNLSIVVVEHA